MGVGGDGDGIMTRFSCVLDCVVVAHRHLDGESGKQNFLLINVMHEEWNQCKKYAFTLRYQLNFLFK